MSLWISGIILNMGTYSDNGNRGALSVAAGRREFLGGAAAFAGAAAFGAGTAQSADGPQDSVRFLAFADIHYSPAGFWPQGNREWLDRGAIQSRREVLEIFAEANRRRAGTVRLVINGHEHKDYFRYNVARNKQKREGR